MGITKEQFLDLLLDWGACEEGIRFVREHLSEDVKTIIIDLPDIGWMIWLLSRLDLESHIEGNNGFIEYYKIVSFKEKPICEFLETGEILWYSGVETTEILKEKGFEFPWSADVEKALKNKIGDN